MSNETQAGEQPILQFRVADGNVLIVGNEAGFRMLGETLGCRNRGTQYAERLLNGDGKPQTVCGVCCNDDEVGKIGVEDQRVQAALDELWTYYNVDDPLPAQDRFGLVRNGLTI